MTKFIVSFFETFRRTVLEDFPVSGLTNALLMNYPTFNEETVNAIESFLNCFHGPICLIGEIFLTKEEKPNEFVFVENSFSAQRR